MGGSRIAVVVIAGALAVLAAPVGAQPDDEIEMEPEGGSGSAVVPTDPVQPVKDPKMARKWLQAAQVLVQKGDYFLLRLKKPDEAKAQFDNAVLSFQKAIEAGDDVNVYFDLASVEDKLGKTDEAARHYRVVIKAQATARPDVLKKATAKLEEAMAKLGLVTLVVNPEGATISLAGTELGKSPLPDPLILMPGSYTFSFAADGFQPKETEIKVEAGSESERGIDLEPVKIIVEPVKQAPDPIEQVVTAKPPSKLPLYIGGGAAVGLVGVATVAGILAVGKNGTFKSADASENERRDAKSSGERLARITDVTMVGALVAGGFTAYWYLFKYKPAQKKFSTERNDPVASKVTVVPWVQSSTGGGVTLAGWF